MITLKKSREQRGGLYHIRLNVTLNQIRGNLCIWAQPHARRLFPNRVTILCVLYFYCIHFISAFHIHGPTKQFGLTTIKFELTRSLHLELWSRTHTYLPIIMKNIMKNKCRKNCFLGILLKDNLLSAFSPFVF